MPALDTQEVLPDLWAFLSSGPNPSPYEYPRTHLDIVLLYIFFCLCLPIINHEAECYRGGSKVGVVGGTIRKALGRVGRAPKLKTENHI